MIHIHTSTHSGNGEPCLLELNTEDAKDMIEVESVVEWKGNMVNYQFIKCIFDEFQGEKSYSKTVHGVLSLWGTMTECAKLKYCVKNKHIVYV